MSEKVSIEITLDGKSYLLTGDESKEYMTKLADYISQKEAALDSDDKIRELPNRLRDYMMRFCIADDYFKALDEIMDLKTVIEKKDEEIYALKHELAKTQTNLSHIKHNIPANNKIAIYSFFRFIISYVLKFSTLFYTPLQRRKARE